MKTRIVTGLLFAFAVAAFILPGFWTPLVPLLFLTLIAVMGIREIRNALAAHGMGTGKTRLLWVGVVCSFFAGPAAVWLYATAAGKAADGEAYAESGLSFLLTGAKSLMAPAILRPALLMACFATAVFVLFLFLLTGILADVLRSGTSRFGASAASAAGAMYVALPLYCAAAMLYVLPDGMYWVIPALVSPWVTDVAAYFTGSFLGKHKIVPAISPKKTWEGCIGGMIGCMAAMLAWVFLVVPHPAGVKDFQLLLFALLIGMVAGVVSQAGDWFASAIKRWSGIKDFGNLLPGHGGILDRFDSVLFTLPGFFAAAVIISFFTGVNP